MVFINKIAASVALISLALVSNAPQVDALSNTPNAHRAVHARGGHNGGLVARPVVQRSEEELKRIQRRSTKVCRSKEPAKNEEKPSTPTTSHIPSSTPTSGGGTSGGGSSGGNRRIKGLGWSSLAGNADISHFVTPDVAFVYTWSADCPDDYKKLGLQCGVMLWGEKMLTEFRKNRGSATILMGMNEVNQDDQADMTVSAGVKMWDEEICPYSKGKLLVSPSTNQAPSGDAWIKSWLPQVKCQPDVIAVHWYGLDSAAMIAQLKQWNTDYNKPLWITEFACQDYSGKNQPCKNPMAFMKDIVAFCEATSWVHGYFAFGLKEKLGHLDPANRLMNSEGAITDLGKAFVGTS